MTAASLVQPSLLKLSICITTFNRSALIGETLESILTQTPDNCEVVVLDGGSTDDTAGVVSEYTRRFDRLRYVRQDVNNGFDRDCNRVVELAQGEYCWLMTDDDLLKPGAVAAGLCVLHQDVSLVVVNAEIRNFDMSQILQPRFLDFKVDRIWGPEEMDRLAFETSGILRYVAGFVIRRAIWISREKDRYYDSLFAYFGVIFQKHLPGSTYAVAEPLISYRFGNSHTFSSKSFETFLIDFPSLVWSMGTLSETTKCHVERPEPWRDPKELLLYRSWGFYSLNEYRRLIRPRVRSIRETVLPVLIAFLPGVLLNTLFVLYVSVMRRWYRGLWTPELLLLSLKESRFYVGSWLLPGNRAGTWRRVGTA